MHREFALRGRAVEWLGHRREADAAGGKLGQGVDHVPHGPEGPVVPPDEQCVELALLCVEEPPVQLRPFLARAAGPVVDQGVREDPAPALDEGDGLVLLKARVLIEARDAKVTVDSELDAFHKGYDGGSGTLSTPSGQEPAVPQEQAGVE